MILPVPVSRNRLLAPLCVFIFGMSPCLHSGVPSARSHWRPRRCLPAHAGVAAPRRRERLRLPSTADPYRRRSGAPALSPPGPPPGGIGDAVIEVAQRGGRDSV